MKIALLRHGIPKYPDTGWVTGAEYANWLVEFNENGLTKTSRPPIKLVEMVKLYRCSICSDLLRSIESANHLGILGEKVKDKQFREAELPVINSSSIRLPPTVWTVLARILWLFGYSQNCESKTTARLRAKACATKLIELASVNNSVLLCGHGFINRDISRELVSAGWQGKGRQSHEFWSINVYEKP